MRDENLNDGNRREKVVVRFSRTPYITTLTRIGGMGFGET